MVQPVEGLVAPLALGPAAVGVQPGVPLQLVVSAHAEILLNTEVITRLELPTNVQFLNKRSPDERGATAWL